MTASYIDELNNLYKQRVFIAENVGLGPKAEDDYEAPVRHCLKCKEESEECKCDEMEKAKSEDDIVLAKKPTLGVSNDSEESHYETGEHPEHEASNMVKQNLYRITKMSAMLFDIIPDD